MAESSAERWRFSGGRDSETGSSGGTHVAPSERWLEVADLVKRKGADLHILNLNIATSSATGKLLLTMIAAVATFERELMLERQREGIARAKSDGKYKGRKPTARHEPLRSRR